MLPYQNPPLKDVDATASCRYWLGVVSRRHVLQGMEGGFAQVRHGKAASWKKTKPNDWLLYYSPKEDIASSVSDYQRFTAIGQIISQAPYPVGMEAHGNPYRIDVHFMPCKEVSWHDVKHVIHFKSKLRFGFAEIGFDDFAFIQSMMLR